MQTTSVLATTTVSIAQTQPQATATARTEYRQEQLHQIQPDYYSLSQYPVTDSNEGRWRNLLWTTSEVEPQEAFVAEAFEWHPGFNAAPWTFKFPEADD